MRKVIRGSAAPGHPYSKNPQVGWELTDVDESERARLAQVAADAIAELKEVDPDWEDWYDNDLNVPPDAPFKEIARLVRERIDKVRGGK
jgi:hypothetical protein